MEILFVRKIQQLHQLYGEHTKIAQKHHAEAINIDQSNPCNWAVLSSVLKI